jgi:hypothetical protein
LVAASPERVRADESDMMASSGNGNGCHLR